MWKKIDPKTLTENVFSMIGDQWMLVNTRDGDRCNTMTASWGALGVIWKKPSATIYIRQSRYTRELLDRNEYFTLSFFGEDYREQLALCGKKSGRDTDKVKECGFTVLEAECGAPYLDQAQLTLVCRKRYVQPLDPQSIPQDAREAFYGDEDYHIMYIGEIVEAYQK